MGTPEPAPDREPSPDRRPGLAGPLGLVSIGREGFADHARRARTAISEGARPVGRASGKQAVGAPGARRALDAIDDDPPWVDRGWDCTQCGHHNGLFDDLCAQCHPEWACDRCGSCHGIRYSQCTVCQPPLALDAGPCEAGPCEAGPCDAGPCDASPRDPGPRDPGPRNADRPAELYKEEMQRALRVSADHLAEREDADFAQALIASFHESAAAVAVAVDPEHCMEEPLDLAPSDDDDGDRSGFGSEHPAAGVYD